MKAVYTADVIYFLIQYDDPTQSVRRSPYVKQADGSWKKLSDQDDKGGTYYLKAEDKAAFDDSKFAPGDEVASIMVEKFTGERGVNDAALEYRNGKYTYVIARKPVTGGKYDIRFKDLAAEHPFGFAAFDNAQVRHAVNGGVLKLKFAR